MKYLLSILFLGLQYVNGQYAISLNLKKGNTYFLNMQANISLNTEMNGQKTTISSTMDGMARFEVRDATDSGFVLDCTYDSMHMTVRSPMGKFEYSTDKAQAVKDGTVSAMNAMAMQHFTVTLLKNGAIKKIHHPDSSGMAGMSGMEGMMKNFPGMDQMKKMMMMGHMRQGFSEKSMRENLERMTAIFPNKKVKLNEEWGYTIMPDSASDHMVKTVYRLVDYSGGIATIKGTSSSKANNSQKHNSMFPATYDFDGTSEMTFKVDASTGWIKEADLKKDLVGQVQMKSQSSGNNSNKTIPVQMKAVAKLSSQ